MAKRSAVRWVVDWASIGNWGGGLRRGACAAGADLRATYSGLEPFPNGSGNTRLEPRNSTKLSTPECGVGHRGGVGGALPSRDVAPPQARPRRTHALCARPAPLHPGTRRSRHFAGHSLALAAAILRWSLALGEPRLPRRRPPAATRSRLLLPLAASRADSTPGPPWDHPRPGACRRCPAWSVRIQAARRPGPWSWCRQGPHH